jgi:hypothetical protein
MSLTINAVTDHQFDIRAAAERLSLPTKRLMARADLHPTSRMTLAEVNAKLSASPLTAEERIALKIALERSHIMTVE